MNNALAALRRRLSFANIVSLVALFVALGGTSYAVATGGIDSREIRNNTVRGVDIRNNTVQGKDIRNNSVGTRDVRNFSLLARDFAPGQLQAGPPGATGAPGLPGPPGPQGEKGDDGSNGATNVVVRTDTVDDVPGGSWANLTPQCEGRERATGGGAGFTDFGGTEQLMESKPAKKLAAGQNTDVADGETPDAWTAAIRHTGAATTLRDAVGYVVCARP